jgi:proline dehydrogenase
MLLAAGRSPRIRAFAEEAAPLQPVVDRFVAGTDLDAALPVIARLTVDRLVTVDHLGENTTDRAGAEAAVAAYRELLLRLAAEGLADRVEVSVKLSALGQGLPDGDALALDGARAICGAAAEAGTTVTVDMEDHTTTDATLATVVALRADFPWVGAVLQSQLRRTEADCRDLAGPGSRVRLCKGAYEEPESVAFTDRADVDRSYVRCMKILFGGEGLPLVATHDPRLVAIAQHLGRDRPYELQMLYGVRPNAQVELAAAGERMRVYVPYGTQWYGYFMRRLAERPANVAFFLRALASRG